MASILVVDDSPERHDWFQPVLERLGHDVRMAFDAPSALDMFHECQFDLVFFDHDLGEGMNGSQLAFQILNNPNRYIAPKAVWVHSQNPVGVKNIRSKFDSVGIPTRAMSFDHLVTANLGAEIERFIGVLIPG